MKKVLILGKAIKNKVDGQKPVFVHKNRFYFLDRDETKDLSRFVLGEYYLLWVISEKKNFGIVKHCLGTRPLTSLAKKYEGINYSDMFSKKSLNSTMFFRLFAEASNSEDFRKYYEVNKFDRVNVTLPESIYSKNKVKHFIKYINKCYEDNLTKLKCS